MRWHDVLGKILGPLPTGFLVGVVLEGIRLAKDKPAVNGTKVRFFSREKTLADCFKYRNKIGLDTAVEALKRYKQQGRMNAETLMQYAQTCRVANVIRPYLEVTL